MSRMNACVDSDAYADVTTEVRKRWDNINNELTECGRKVLCHVAEDGNCLFTSAEETGLDGCGREGCATWWESPDGIAKKHLLNQFEVPRNDVCDATKLLVPHYTAAKIADKVRGVAPRLRSSDSADIVPDGNANERSDTEAVFNYLLRKTRTPRKWGTWFQLLPMAHICGRPIVIRQVQKRTGPNAEVARIPLVENVNVFFPKGVDDITRERVLSAAGPFDNDVIVFANDGSHFWPTVPINNPSCSDDEKQCLEQLGVQLLSQPVWTTNPLSALSDTCYNSPSDDDVRAYWQELRDIQGEARAQSLRKRHNVTTSLNQLRGLGDGPCSYGLLHGAATILGQPIVVVNQASRLDADGCFQFDSKCLYTPQNWTVKDVDRFQTSPFKVVDDFHVLLQHGNLWCGTTNYSGPPDIDADGLKFTKTGKLPLGVWFLLLLLLPFVLLLPPLSVSPPSASQRQPSCPRRNI